MKVYCALIVTLAAVCSAEPPVNRYLPPGQNSPSSQYGAPNAPSNQYGAPGGGSHSQAFRPSQNYGAPRPSQNYGAPSNQGYGGQGHNDEQYNEPANYNFEYMVQDQQSGNDFGHKESRQGDNAEGEYYVLLPDGRKQIVTYQADQQGYRPKIRYEDTGAGNGYGSGSVNGGHSGAGNGYGSGPANGGHSGFNSGHSSGSQGPY